MENERQRKKLKTLEEWQRVDIRNNNRDIQEADLLYIVEKNLWEPQEMNENRIVWGHHRVGGGAK